MPQETNFNVSPYFDDFDKNKDYYRVLFKPGYPVQARELTTSQSILQNQVEQFANKFFKEGEIVIPGSLIYNNPIYSVEIEQSYNGLPVSLYFQKLKGKVLKGLNSGVTAEVFALIDNVESERNNFTLYVKYLESGGEDLTIKRFQDGETLVPTTAISYGESNKFVIQANQGICNTISLNSTDEGSAIFITEGVCYTRGIFVNVSPQILVLSQYDTVPNYKVGFDIVERIVTSDEDQSLYDNARNFSNFTAPGADRLKIELFLAKKDLNSIENDSFVELMRVVDGIPLFSDSDNDQVRNIITAKTEASRAISETSGDFFIKSFSVNVKDSLNDCFLNDGVFFETQSTVSGNTPSEDKIVYQIGPGKAYVDGFAVETTSSRLLDADKPRASDDCTKEIIPFNAGTLYVLNNTVGSASIGLSTNATISLMSDRLGGNKYVAAGATIGLARVYDFIPESEYQNDLSRMHLRLFDAQTFVDLKFAKPVIVERPAFVEGKKSGATGHVYNTFSELTNIQTIQFTGGAVGISTILLQFGKLGDPVVGVATIGLGPLGTAAANNLNNGDFIFITGTGYPQIDFPTGGKFQISQAGITTYGQFEITLQSQPNVEGAIEDAFGGYTIENFGTITKVSTAATVNSTSHGLTSGQQIVIRGTNNNDFNRSFIVDQVFNASSFSLLDSDGTTLIADDNFNGLTSAIGGEHLTVLDEIKLYEVKGQFSSGEQVILNGEIDNRLVKEVVEYSLSDVKSVFSQKIGISTFNGDVILDKKSFLAPAGTLFNITPDYNSGGISTISATVSTNITTALKVGDIITYTTNLIGSRYPENPDGFSDPIYNKVVSINSNGKSFEVVGITSVPGFINGSAYLNESSPEQSDTSTNIAKVSSSVYSSLDGGTLLTKFNNSVLSQVDFDNNVILQRRLFREASVINKQITIEIDPTEEDITFASFDEDRYVITYTNGNKETIRFDRFKVENAGKRAIFTDLQRGPVSGNGIADVIATVRNTKPNSKTKTFNAASVITVNGSSLKTSGTGEGTLDDGLTYRRPYGTRVQDKIISLNTPDVVRVIGIFESSTTSEPTLPNVQLINSSNANYVTGELLIGETSKAVGVLVNKINSDILEFVYVNSRTFEKGESIIGKETGTRGLINSIVRGDKNITQNYIFDDGQRSTYYDYSRIIRAKNVEAPTKQLKIVFQNYTVKSTDDGEFYTVNSYSNRNYKFDVASFNGIRLTDYVDIRPRLNQYDTNNTTKSPFEYGQRDFSGQGQASRYTLAPEENIEVCYKYYVGRIDKLILKPNGEFSVVQGEPSLNPKEPLTPDNCLVIGTINLPPYVFNVKSIEVNIENHKNYTMQDIASLEERITRLEEFTILNAAETKTENLKLIDAETGIERLKCGFFVDTFSNTNLHDQDDPNYKIAIDDENNIMRPTHYTTFIDMQLGSEVISGVAETFDQTKDHDFVTDLGSNNIRKTGDLISLNYSDLEYFNQPYATRTESVTPYLVKYWTGSIELRPSSDSWIEEREEVNQSFATNTEELPRLPDINIVRVNNVTTNQTVFRNNVVTQRGIFRGRWITARGSWWRRGLWRRNTRGNGRRAEWWRQFQRNSTWLSSSVRAVNGRQVVRFRAIRQRLTSADINWLRSILPQDIANNYITQVQSAGINRAIFLEFSPGAARDEISTTRTVSTSVQTNSNTVTTTIPPEINVTTTVEESESNFTEPTRFLRSRNIEFDVKGLRPRTRFYSFFEGIDIKDYVVPKLLEIEMVQGKFQIGELVESDPSFTSKKIRFRLCKPNHKTGPFATPEETFISIPYRQSAPPEAYTESSDYLNVDTRALQLNSETDYYGEVSVNMRVIGKTSGAVARITNIRLVSDNGGRLIGSLYIPDPKVSGNPKWNNGENTFTVIDTPSLSELASGDGNTTSESSAEEEFTSSSTTNVTVRNILTTRNIRITPARNINTTTVTNVRNNTTAVTQTRVRRRTGAIVRRWEVKDPLAQSFFVKDETGIFLTAVDVYFETKDESGVPVTLQLRTMENGIPTTTVFPFSEVTLTPDQINLSVNGIIPTRFTFASPVYLAGPQGKSVRGAPIASEATAEYAVVLLSNSSNYRVFISRLGENDILTNIKVGAQPTLGSLFKSQNGSTWTPSQLEDLKYKLYRAEFVDSGVVKYYNPILALKNQKVTVLGPNQLTTLDRRSIIKLNDYAPIRSDLQLGSTIYQTNNGQGKLVAIGGSIVTGTGVTISNVGFGYTNGTFTNNGNGYDLITISGFGNGGKANVTVSGGVISDVSIIDGGFGYVEGDTLSIPSIGQDVGFGGQVTVDNVKFKNTLVAENVVSGLELGDSASFVTGRRVFFIDSSTGIGTYVGINSTSTVIPDPGPQADIIINNPKYDGLHMKIDAVNHGMHSVQNYVRISNVRPEDDQVNSTLSTEMSSTETSVINLTNTAGFETFEGLPVNGDNPGYIIIGNEIVGYTTYSATSLGAGTPTITRAVVGEPQPYDVGTPVYKYELNGISLRRINKVHTLSGLDENVFPLEFNSFHIPIETTSTDFEGNAIGKGRSGTGDLVFRSTDSLGDSGSIVSTNVTFDILTPNFATIVPSETSIKAKVRTISGTSIDGNESSFVDKGYVEMSLDQPVMFNNPRLIASRVNETRYLTDLPGNRSLTMEFELKTEDSRVSPIIDDITTGAILTSNLVNAPAGIGDNSSFADVEYIRGGDDKHEAVYISKPILLKLPANSIKLFLKSARTENNDIRVLYKLYREDSADGDPNFEPFPGYINYRTDANGIKRVVDASKNDGSSDSRVSVNSNVNFSEYEYTIDNLPEFTGFAIKIIFASTNQSEPPLAKELRAIATLKPGL
jgi:hypothetical protein